MRHLIIGRGQAVVLFVEPVVLLAFGRVLFYGDKATTAGDVAKCVLSACALISPPLTAVVKRAFPYASLTLLDFLTLKGCVRFPVNTAPSVRRHPAIVTRNRVVGCCFWC